MLLVDDLDIVAEYQEYSEESYKSLWGKPYPCWIQFDALKQELSIKFEYEQEGKPNTYVWFTGERTGEDINTFELFPNKPDVTNETIWLEASFDGEFWYFDGEVEEIYTERVNGVLTETLQKRFISIAQVDDWKKDY